jgi:hypothetical protein
VEDSGNWVLEGLVNNHFTFDYRTQKKVRAISLERIAKICTELIMLVQIYMSCVDSMHLHIIFQGQNFF